MKIETIRINSAYSNAIDQTCNKDLWPVLFTQTVTVTALIIFDDKTKPSITVTLEIPQGHDWMEYIKSLLSNIQF